MPCGPVAQVYSCTIEGDRLKQQMRYSQPMANGKRALAIRWHQTEREKEELKQTREQIRVKQREIVIKYSGTSSRTVSSLGKWSSVQLL